MTDKRYFLAVDRVASGHTAWVLSSIAVDGMITVEDFDVLVRKIRIVDCQQMADMYDEALMRGVMASLHQRGEVIMELPPAPSLGPTPRRRFPIPR